MSRLLSPLLAIVCLGGGCVAPKADKVVLLNLEVTVQAGNEDLTFWEWMYGKDEE